MKQDRTSFYEGLIKEEDHLDAVLMFMMFALHEDYKSRLGDDVTKNMMDYVANHWLENLLEKLSEDGNFSSSDLKKIRVHIERASNATSKPYDESHAGGFGWT